MLFRLQLRHPKQEAEQVELVAPRQSRKVGHGVGNEGDGLFRPTLPAWLFALRSPLPARGGAHLPASCAGEELNPMSCLFKNIRLLRLQLWDAFYNFFDIVAQAAGMLSTSVHLTGASAAPMFGAKRPTRIPRNRPLFFP
jgi:hypothetical protein